MKIRVNFLAPFFFFTHSVACSCAETPPVSFLFYNYTHGTSMGCKVVRNAVCALVILSAVLQRCPARTGGADNREQHRWFLGGPWDVKVSL